MTSLVCRASICAGLAVTGFAALSQAQSTTTVLPERPTELRRAPLPVAAAPVVQQSPNGLYQLSITDTGIELLGPKGVVRITDAGIEIGATTTTTVAIKASDMNVRVDRNVRLDVGSNLDIMASSAVQIAASTGASLIGSVVNLGCSNGKPAARASDQVNTTVSPAVILQGSQTVRVC